jgi:hypothetical protein
VIGAPDIVGADALFDEEPVVVRVDLDHAIPKLAPSKLTIHPSFGLRILFLSWRFGPLELGMAHDAGCGRPLPALGRLRAGY